MALFMKPSETTMSVTDVKTSRDIHRNYLKQINRHTKPKVLILLIRLLGIKRQINQLFIKEKEL